MEEERGKREATECAGVRITEEVLGELIARIRRFQEAVDRVVESAGRPAE